MDCNSDVKDDTNSYLNVVSVSDDEEQLTSNFNKMSLNHNYQSIFSVPKQLEQPFPISLEYRLYQLLSNLEIIDLLSNELDPILDSFYNLFIAIRDNQKSAKKYIKLLNCVILPNSFNYQEIYKFMTLNVNDINKYWAPILSNPKRNSSNGRILAGFCRSSLGKPMSSIDDIGFQRIIKYVIK